MDCDPAVSRPSALFLLWWISFQRTRMQIRKWVAEMARGWEWFKMTASKRKEKRSESNCGTRKRRDGTKCSRDDSRVIKYKLGQFAMYPATTKPYILSNYRAITLQPWPWQITRTISAETSIPQKPSVAKPFPWGGGKENTIKRRIRWGYELGRSSDLISKPAVQNKD